MLIQRLGLLAKAGHIGCSILNIVVLLQGQILFVRYILGKARYLLQHYSKVKRMLFRAPILLGIEGSYREAGYWWR